MRVTLRHRVNAQEATEPSIIYPCAIILLIARTFYFVVIFFAVEAETVPLSILIKRLVIRQSSIG